jgi:hypothetical protein
VREGVGPGGLLLTYPSPDIHATAVESLALVPRHLWRARYLVTSAVEDERVQVPREAFDLLIKGFPLANDWPKASHERHHK